MPFYAVYRGREKGIYRSWAEAKEQVHQLPRAVWKKFTDLEQAQAFLIQGPPSKRSRASSGQPPLVRHSAPQSEPLPVGLPATDEDEEKQLQAIYLEGQWLVDKDDESIPHHVQIWFGPGDPRNYRGACPLAGKQIDQQRLILGAAIMAINRFHQFRLRERIGEEIGRLILYSESLYLNHAMNFWLKGWHRSNYKNGTIQNQDLFKLLSGQVQGTDIKFRFKSGVGGFMRARPWETLNL